MTADLTDWRAGSLRVQRLGEGKDAVMADTDAAPTARDPDTLVTEIQRTRDNLARTIDAIAERVSPASNARRALQRARDQASRVDVHYVAAGITIVAGFTAALMIWRYRR